MFGDKQKIDEMKEIIENVKELVQGMQEEHEAFQVKLVEHVDASLKPAIARLDAIEKSLESLQDDVDVLALEGNGVRVDVNGLIETTSQTSAYLAGLIGNLKDAVEPFQISRDNESKPRPRPLEERGFQRPGGKE